MKKKILQEYIVAAKFITGSLFSGGGGSKSLFALSNAPQCQCHTHTACLVTSVSFPNPIYGNPSP